MDSGEAPFVLLAQAGDRLLDFGGALLAAPLGLVDGLAEVGDALADIIEAPAEAINGSAEVGDGGEDRAFVALLVFGELGVDQFGGAVLPAVAGGDHVDEDVGEALVAAVGDEALAEVGRWCGHGVILAHGRAWRASWRMALPTANLFRLPGSPSTRSARKNRP